MYNVSMNKLTPWLKQYWFVPVAIFISAIWGGSWVVHKLAAEQLPAFHIVFLRFFATALVFLPFVKKVKKEVLINLFQIALVLNVFHMGFNQVSMYFLGASAAGVLQLMTTPITMLLALVLLREKITRIQMLGITIAIIGILIIRGLPEINGIGVALMLGSAIAWGLAQIKQKQLGKIDLPTFTAYTCLFSVPFLAVCALCLDTPVDYANIDWMAYSPILLFQVVILAAALAIWQKMNAVFGVNKIAPFVLLNSIFAMIAGALFLNENISIIMIIGALITISGLAISTFVKK